MNRRERRAAGKHGKGSPGTAPLFALAARHHQAGQLGEAEKIYRQVLTLDRRHFGSLYHLGIIALQRSQPHAAVEMIGRALAVNDRIPESLYNMAFALQSVGRRNDAVASYQAAIRLEPKYVEAHTNLGNVFKDLGRHGDAVLSYERVIALEPTANAHYNLANALSPLGRLDEAVSHYRRALALAPDLVGAHTNLANALVAQGQLDEALMHSRRAIELDPNLPEAHVNLGTTLLQQGSLDAAATQLERAISVNPNFADAYCNLGNVLLAQGRLDEAAQHYARAIDLEPALSGAHNNLGIVLAARGKFEEAGRRFQSALACKPDFIDAYNNLARVFLSLGQSDNALGTVRRALAVAQTPDIKSLFVQCAKALTVPPDVEDFRALLIRALSEPWGRPHDLASVAAGAVKQDRALRPCINRVLDAWPRRLSAGELLGPDGLAAISGNRLLQCLLEAAPVADVVLERLLTRLRSVMLEFASGADASLVADENATRLACALARQCFLNEQVFTLAATERRQAEQLRDAVIAALAAGAPISEIQMAAVAAYFPLHSLPGVELLLDRTWSPAVTAVLVQQVQEPVEERRLRASIPALTAIEDGVSRKVQQQYEENPYPRWGAADPPGQPLSFDNYLRRRLPASPFRNLDKAQIDVLVAGCGTGQHAIETAQRFSGANVLAVDLSPTSLAYAVRKTRAFGCGQISYAQADILALGSIGRSFDLIEASGVLHHLADPLAGWRVLLSLLRPGGFMTIGLYSEIARAHIVEARAFIAEQGYQPTGEDIRRCRQELMSSDHGRRFQTIAASGDFFSMSGCRDLLFHVQEHRFTIPQLAAFLAENNLAFVGFDLDHFTTRRYLSRFPHDETMTELACWDALERDDPSTFSGMYQFWVQKPEAAN